MNPPESSDDAASAIRQAVALASGTNATISHDDALMRISTRQLEQVLHDSFQGPTQDVLTTGLGASPGAAVGTIVLNADEAMMATDDVILVREETSPADVHGMAVAVGILTTRGGLASHAAVVARGWGKPAVCGAEGIEIRSDHILVNGERIEVGETISIDGQSGHVMRGAIKSTEAEDIPEIETLLAWADESRNIAIR
nr:PEP-utilizing enzyme [Acidimicrobiales bacterium]